MAVLHEDTVAGSADISGDPAPVSARSLSNRKADVSRAMNTRPKPGGSAPPAPPASGKSGDKKKNTPAGTEEGLQKKGDTQPQQQLPQAPPPATGDQNPYAPVDWKKAQEADPWMVHHVQSRQADAFAALLDPSLAEGAKESWQRLGDIQSAAIDVNAIRGSTRTMWEQNTAQAALMRFVLTANPVEALAPSKQGGANVGDAVADVGQFTANPVNALAPEKIGLQAAIFVAPNIINALASSNPHDQASAMVWAAATGSLLSLGHLPPGAKKALMESLNKAVGKWPQLEGMLNDIGKGRDQHTTNIQDPASDVSQKWLDPALKKDFLAEKERVLKTAADPNAPDTFTSGKTAKGEPIMKSANKEKMARALKKIGYKSRQELVDAANDRQLTTRQSKLLEKHWQDLGFTYDLKGVTAGDRSPRDPRITVKDAPDDVHAKAYSAMTAANHLVQQMHIGPVHNALDPNVSMWRSLLGVHRGTGMAHDGFMGSMMQLAGHLDGVALGKAAEGSQAHYDALPHEGKAFVDILHIVNNEMRIAREDSGYAKNAVGQFMYRLLKRTREPLQAPHGVGGAFGSARNKSRTLQADVRPGAEGDSEIVMTQAYDTVQESTGAQRAKRTKMLEEITKWDKSLPKKYARDTEALDIRKLYETDPAGAQERAAAWAADRYPDFEENALKVLMSGSLGRNINAVHRFEAIEHWKGEKVAGPNGEKLPAAFEAGKSAYSGQLKSMGYRSALSVHGGGSSWAPKEGAEILFHPDLADLIDHASTYANQKGPAATQALGEIERRAVGLIMYSPMIHGMNMAGRMLLFAGTHLLTHPGVYTSSMKKMGATASVEAAAKVRLTAHGAEEAAHENRMEAFNAGVVSHGHRGTLPDGFRQMANSLDDPEAYKIPGGPEAAHPDFSNIGRPTRNPVTKLNKWFWSRVDDFAVTAYHIEKDAAMASGVSEEQAKQWATRRANTWAGYVAKEDVRHPYLYDAARTVFFAPAFWKTWAEIFVPMYKNSGIGTSEAMTRHIVKQELAIASSAVMMQQLTGNALNLIMSGKTQYQNQPQNRHRVEVTRPAIIRAFQAAHYPGSDKIDPDTGHGPNGEVLTYEDPFSRFQKDAEGVAGFDSGHTDWKPQDAEDGTLKFAAARLSPVIGTLGALGNVDIYRMLTTHFRQAALDPDRPAGDVPHDAGQALKALLYLAPNGSQLLQSIKANSKTKKEKGDYEFMGMRMSKGVVDAFGGTAEAALWTGMTGVNAPYVNAERTRGETPTDQDRAAVDKLKADHTAENTAWSAMALGGQRTPQQWLQHHQESAKAYHQELASHYNHAPEFVHGPQSLVHSWEQTYVDATDPVSKELDPSKLAQLQNDWNRQHSNEDRNARDNELNKNSHDDRMSGLYFKTMDAYRKWQETWAAQNGVDINALRQGLRDYNAAYGDRAKSAHILSTNHDLALYERAKKVEFEHSPLGLMYGLFHGTRIVSAYMNANQLTAQQVEQDAEKTNAPG